MKVNKTYKPKPFRFKDNFNINYEPYYIIEQGVYKFLDKVTMYTFMYHYGIMCQCTRTRTNKNFIYTYNGQPINEAQRDFMRKRALVLQQSLGLNTTYVKHNCGCKKE